MKQKPDYMNIEKNLRQFIDGDQFTNGIKPLERYASFDYCFNYFQAFREQNRVKDIADPAHIQESCLQLGFYLASWGMLRGSSFLLTKSLKVFERLIHEIANADPLLWEIDANSYSLDNIQTLLDFRRTIVQALDRHPTNILVTKIMLGVFGNVPAFDTNFMKGFGVSVFGKYALEKVSDFYETNKSIVEQNRMKTLDFIAGQATERIYTRAKVIDMIFFIEGANQGRGRNTMTEERLYYESRNIA